MDETEHNLLRSVPAVESKAGMLCEAEMRIGLKRSSSNIPLEGRMSPAVEMKDIRRVHGTGSCCSAAPSSIRMHSKSRYLLNPVTFP